ncbi:MAG: hypothetical protein KJN90_09950 [Gammaproteobacteria bacterium]|nr:hypothetical protein [Gammaproteobacteria bacterium]
MNSAKAAATQAELHHQYFLGLQLIMAAVGAKEGGPAETALFLVFTHGRYGRRLSG